MLRQSRRKSLPRLSLIFAPIESRASSFGPAP
jgi:hypothetical protein